MDILFSTLQSFQKNTSLSVDRRNFLNTLNTFQLYNNQQGSTLNDAISVINTSLNSSKSRLWGLLLLHKVLKQCTTSVFEKQAASWIRLLTTITQTYDTPRNINLCCLVLNQLLGHVVQFPELSREFTNTHLAGLINTLITLKSENEKCAIKCLAKCMQLFPGACGPSKNKIEKYVIARLENHETDLCETAIECYVLLPRLGGGGSQGIKHTEEWEMHMNKLLKTINVTLESIYQCVEIDESIDITSTVDSLPLQKITSEIPQRTYHLASRYGTLCKLIMATIGTDFSTTVNIPVKALLNVVFRCFLVSPKLLMTKPTTERVLLASVLPQIYKDTLGMMQELIKCLKGNLVPYCSTVNQCIIQALTSMTMARNYGIQTPFGDVRNVAWDTLLEWINAVGLSSGVEYSMEEFIKQIALDVTPVEEAVKAKASGTSKKLSEVSEHFHAKKGKKKGGSSLIGHLTTQRKIDIDADSQCCFSALAVLNVMYETMGPIMSTKTHTMIVQLIIKILLHVTSNSDCNMVLPFDNPRCRKMLYKVLVTIVKVPHPSVAPPLHCAVNMLASGIKDPSGLVSCFCKVSLSSVENVIHPRAASLNFPIINKQPDPKTDDFEVDNFNTGLQFQTPKNHVSDIDNDTVMLIKTNAGKSREISSDEESTDDRDENVLHLEGEVYYDVKTKQGLLSCDDGYTVLPSSEMESPLIKHKTKIAVATKHFKEMQKKNSIDDKEMDKVDNEYLHKFSAIKDNDRESQSSNSDKTEECMVVDQTHALEQEENNKSMSEDRGNCSPVEYHQKEGEPTLQMVEKDENLKRKLEQHNDEDNSDSNQPSPSKKPASLPDEASDELDMMLASFVNADPDSNPDS